MKRNTKRAFALATAASVLAVSAVSAQQTQQPITKDQVTRLVSSWPQASQQAATMIMDKYGPPAGVTDNMLVWGRTGPWKRTVIYREPVQHRFPMPHPDVMEQFIDYRVPTDKFDELAEYDGSVIAERTKGELSARCDKEGANFLAINLAHEIITDKRSVDEARAFYGEQIMAMQAKRPAPYTERFIFTVASGNTADPDEPIMAAGAMQPQSQRDTTRGTPRDTTRADSAKVRP
ncbi:MAG: hypothetical protein ACREON_14375 [Gemmatimonadaceae bacterium]